MGRAYSQFTQTKSLFHQICPFIMFWRKTATDADFDIVDYYSGNNYGVTKNSDTNFGAIQVMEFVVPPHIEPVAQQVNINERDLQMGLRSSIYWEEDEGTALLDSIKEKERPQKRDTTLASRRRSRMPSISACELDLGLYKPSEQEFPGLSTIHSRGRLHFSVLHDIENCCVIVNAIKASDLVLPGLKSANRIDTFVQVSLVNLKKDGFEPEVNSSSKIFRISSERRDYLYNSSFCLDVDPYSDPSDLELRICVNAVDKYSRKEAIGSVATRLCDTAYFAGPGTILNLWRDLIPVDQELLSQGELSISLQYDTDRERLKACVVTARGILPPQPKEAKLFHEIHDGPGILYVTLSMFSSGNIIRRRKSKTQLHSRTPVFHDEYTFDLKSDMLSEVCLLFTVLSRDSSGYSTMLGQTNVGPYTYASASGVEHWANMMNGHGRSVMMWHHLR